MAYANPDRLPSELWTEVLRKHDMDDMQFGNVARPLIEASFFEPLQAPELRAAVMYAVKKRLEKSSLRTLTAAIAATMKRPGIKKRGKVIVAPNNSGKTTFAQEHLQWTDHDVLLKEEIGLGMKHDMSESDMKQADNVTRRHIQRGTNQLVATWWDPALVDAFVIIDADTLRERGLTAAELSNAAEQAARYRQIASEHNIPVYDAFSDASKALLKTLVFVANKKPNPDPNAQTPPPPFVSIKLWLRRDAALADADEVYLKITNGHLRITMVMTHPHKPWPSYLNWLYVKDTEDAKNVLSIENLGATTIADPPEIEAIVGDGARTDISPQDVAALLADALNVSRPPKSTNSYTDDIADVLAPIMARKIRSVLKGHWTFEEAGNILGTQQLVDDFLAVSTQRRPASRP